MIVYVVMNIRDGHIKNVFSTFSKALEFVKENDEFGELIINDYEVIE